MNLLEIFFPKKCVNCRTFGDYLCPKCFAFISFSTTSICLLCKKASSTGLSHTQCNRINAIDGVFTSLVYKGVTKRLISQFKGDPFLTDLRGVLGDLFYEGLIEQESFFSINKKNALIISMSQSVEEQRHRGYNQAQFLAEDLAKKVNIPFYDLLLRTKSSSVFNIKNKGIKSIKDKTIFVVDDVVLSGETMKIASQVLKEKGVREVYGLALANGL